MSELNEVVIVSAMRTPMGGLQGCFANLSAPQLGAVAIDACLDNISLDKASVNEVYMGNVLSAALGQAPARQAAIGAGIPDSVPTTTLNKVCGSGMKAVMIAADQIKLGTAEIAVAGGMESMSNAPYMLKNARAGYRLGNNEIYDHMFLDGLQDAYSAKAMGVHAQETADEYKLSREDMDAYAISSLDRALAAIENGWFDAEIAPVTLKTRKGEEIIATDEQPQQAKPEKIPNLRPAFSKDGSITAANASSISDGASALVLMSKEKADQLGLKVLAKVVDYTSHAQAPSTFTCAPIGAMKALLERNSLMPNDIDLVEINEAFAMVAMLGTQEVGFDKDRVNITGGACSLGHPLGSSGSRILVTLIHNLIRTGKKRGMASLCIGGGEGTACIIETV